MNPTPPKTERPRSTQLRRIYSRGSLIPLLALLISAAAQVAVAATATDGEGMMSVSPTSVTYGSTGNTFTFTFTANNGDFGSGSQVALTIPDGWTAPTTAAGAGHVTAVSGTATLSGSPPFAITGSTILIDMASCAAGQFFTVTYAGVMAPAVAGSPYPFITQTDIGPGGEGLVNITAGFPTVTVDPATLTVSAAGLTPDNKIYDGTTNATLAVGTPALVGVIGGDSVSLVTSSATGSFADKNFGTAKTVIIAGLTLTGANAGNYTLTQPTRTANITQRPITVNAVTETKTYDGTNSATGIPTLSGGTPLAPGDTVPVWTQSFDNRNVGTGKTLTPAGAIIDGNNGLNYAYTFAPNTSGAITAKGITITATTDSKVYDGSTNSSGVPILSGGTPLAPGDAEPVWIQAFDTKNVGTAKTLTPAGKVSDGNGGLNYAYAFIPVTTGIITAKPLTITATAQSKPYGATLVLNGATDFISTGLQNSETIGSVTLSASGTPAGTAPPAAVGPYTITPSAATGGTFNAANYTITYATGALTVGKAPLSITADNKTKTYGSADPAFTVSYAGFVNSETPAVLGGTLTFTRAPEEDVGEYLIPPSGLTSGNYTITFNAGTLAITTVALSVTADTKTKTYGEADPVFTVSYAGFVNNETPAVLGGTLAFARATGESVGSYLITPSGLTSGNYAITFNPGTLTIVAPSPVILPLARAGITNIVITWTAVSNATYRVQYKSDLSAANWNDLLGDVTASAGTSSKTDIMTTTNRFYRVQVLP